MSDLSPQSGPMRDIDRRVSSGLRGETPSGSVLLCCPVPDAGGRPTTVTLGHLSELSFSSGSWRSWIEADLNHLVETGAYWLNGQAP
jgi:hypothetical protein